MFLNWYETRAIKILVLNEMIKREQPVSIKSNTYKYLKVFFTILILSTTLTIQSQSFKNVDDKVRSYPKNIVSAEQLATQIEHDFSSDTDKVRALFVWLTTNITYDLEKFYKGETKINFSYANQQDLQNKIDAVNIHTVTETMKTKTAVCEGYAQTFKKVSELLKIPSLFITGYSKASINDIGKKPKMEDHAWNAVRIDGKWHLIDATWGAGVAENKKWKPIFNDFYFFTNPDEFLLTHLPTEIGLSFTDTKINVTDFYKTPMYSNAYFKNGLQLISPLEGKLTLASNTSISFELKQLDENVSLHYAFRENMRPTLIEPICKNSKCVFTIPFTGTKNTALFIIANRESALQYKIVVKK